MSQTTVYIVIGLLILAGSIVQGSIGFGLGTLSTPLIAFLEPKLLPVIILCLAFVIASTTVFSERKSVDWPTVGWATLARVPGTLLGTWAVAVLSHDGLSLFIGFAVILAMLLSGLGWAPNPTRGTMLTAGLAAGFLGTSTSVGGPPMALAMKRFEPAKVRSTLASTFVIGSALSLATLAVAGQVSELQLKAAAAYLPVAIIGLVLARTLIPYINSTVLNRAVIIVASTAATGLIIQSAWNLWG